MLRADYVLPADMIRYRWYRPAHRKSGWYYYDPTPLNFSPAKAPALSEIDPLLRPLIAALNRAGALTFPSCQGHFVSRPEFEKQYAQLVRDGRKIRDGGLDFREMETGVFVHYRDLQYEPPDKEALWADVHRYRGHGYLRFTLPRIDPTWLSSLQAKLAASGAHGALRLHGTRPPSVQIDVVTTPDNQAYVWQLVGRMLDPLP